MANMEPYNDPSNPKAVKILTFRPTMEQFSDFLGYIAYMESRNAHLGGIAKVIPPKEWKPRKGGYGDLDNKFIHAPIRQNVNQTSTRGAFEVRNTEEPPMTVGDLRRFAEEKNLIYAFAEEMDEIERNFWKQLSINPPVYGADTSGSLFDDEVDVWNISNLPSALQTINEEYGIAIQGVNTPYLYYGMWRAFFGWHTEDMDLYSINYIHDGAAKFWYSISPQNGRRFERLAQTLFPDQYKACPAFLRHKTTLISHTVLKSSGVPFNKIMQQEGEIIITFPYAYHAGFNCGLNVAESTNFATERWIEYGKYASMCSCVDDNVKIDMGIFVKKYQPDRMQAWEDGTERGRHPEDERIHYRRPPTSGPAAIIAAATQSSPKKSQPGQSRRRCAAAKPSSPDSVSVEESKHSQLAKRSFPAANEYETMSSPSSMSPSCSKKKKSKSNKSKRKRPWQRPFEDSSDTDQEVASLSHPTMPSSLPLHGSFSQESEPERPGLCTAHPPVLPEDHLYSQRLSPISDCAECALDLRKIKPLENDWQPGVIQESPLESSFNNTGSFGQAAGGTGSSSPDERVTDWLQVYSDMQLSRGFASACSDLSPSSCGSSECKCLCQCHVSL